MEKDSGRRTVDVAELLRAWDSGDRSEIAANAFLKAERDLQNLGPLLAHRLLELNEAVDAYVVDHFDKRCEFYNGRPCDCGYARLRSLIADPLGVNSSV